MAQSQLPIYKNLYGPQLKVHIYYGTKLKFHILLWHKIKCPNVTQTLKSIFIMAQTQIIIFFYLFKSPYIIMAQTQKSANYGSNSKVHILLWHQLKCPYIKVYMAPPLQFICPYILFGNLKWSAKIV